MVKLRGISLLLLAWIPGVYYGRAIYHPADQPEMFRVMVGEIARLGLWAAPLGLAAGWWLVRRARELDGEPEPVEVPGRALLAAIGGWIAAEGALFFLLRGSESLVRTFLAQATAVVFFIEALPEDSKKCPFLPRGLKSWRKAATMAVVASLLALPVLSCIYFLGREIRPEVLQSLPFTTPYDPRNSGELFFSVLAIPFLEEILFRAGFIGYLKRYSGAWPAIIISAAIFSFLHGQHEIFWARFVAGLMFGWLYVRTASVAPSTVLHGLMNAAIFVSPIVLGERV